MVSTVSSSPSSSLPSPLSQPAEAKSELGKDAFVRLLLTQLQSQDPTAPQSSEAFVAQLAQFTSVELAQQQNSNLESLLLATAASNQTGVSTLVGKDVAFAADTMKLNAAGETRDLRVQLDGAADDVVVSVVDKSGKTVRTLNLEQQNGDVDIAFDGLDDSGQPLPPGDYTLKVVARAGDKDVDASILQRGHVDGVSFVDGIATLLVGGLKIRLPDVVEIHERQG